MIEQQLGQNGTRLVVPSLKNELGTDFMVGVRYQDLPQFRTGLEMVKKMAPSAEMAAEADQLLVELDAPADETNSIGDKMRLIRIKRTVDLHSHSLPTVTDCDSVRVLTFLAAIIESLPDLISANVEGIIKSGVSLKMRRKGKMGFLIKVFDDEVFIQFGDARRVQ
jgi:hypothetical protein